MRLDDYLDGEIPAITPKYGSQVKTAGRTYLERLERLHAAASNEANYEHLIAPIERQMKRTQEFLKMLPTVGD